MEEGGWNVVASAELRTSTFPQPRPQILVKPFVKPFPPELDQDYEYTELAKLIFGPL